MTYEFECPECKERVEIECKMSEREEVANALACGKCNRKLVQVLFPPSMLGSTGGYDSVAGTASWQRG